MSLARLLNVIILILFTIGAMLARPPATAAVDSPPAGRFKLGDIHLIVVYKLIVHPLLVLGVGYVYTQMGFDLSPQALTVLVLVAALPSASSITVLAEKFEADSRRIAQIVLFSTAIAFLTFSTAVKWLL